METKTLNNMLFGSSMADNNWDFVNDKIKLNTYSDGKIGEQIMGVNYEFFYGLVYDYGDLEVYF